MLQPGDFVTQSDASGRYQFDMSAADGAFDLSCTPDGYASDTISVQLTRGETATADFGLNALPKFENIRLLSDNEATFLFEQGRRYVNLSAAVSDLDGQTDIKLVWCEWPDFGVRDTLRFAPLENAYVSRSRESQLGISNLETLVGKSAWFYAEDQQGAIVKSEVQTIRRVIWTIPKGEEPRGTTTQPFNFTWTRPDSVRGTRFPLTYTVEIYIDSPVFFPPEDVISDIPIETTSLSYNNPALESGQSYYWVLYFVDEFGNRSRSFQNALVID